MSPLHMFQSSPGLLAGRYAGFAAALLLFLCFNPRPAFWPGEYDGTPVSSLPIVNVSILARPFGRAYLSPWIHCLPPRRFQSSPGLLAGRVPEPCWDTCPQDLFQSSPGLLAGRYAALRADSVDRHQVSILARPFGRARTRNSDPLPVIKAGFNPRPAFWPGDYACNPSIAKPVSKFQSSPGLLAGRYVMRPPCFQDRSRFQSSPGLLAGRYTEQPFRDVHSQGVSILARPFGRAY